MSTPKEQFRLVAHPGKLVDHYIHNSRLPVQEYFSNIENLDRLVAGEIPFDDYFHGKFKDYMGAQADILLRLQAVHDYEQKTGRPYSGKGPIPAAA